MGRDTLRCPLTLPFQVLLGVSYRQFHEITTITGRNASPAIPLDNVLHAQFRGQLPFQFLAHQLRHQVPPSL